MISTILVEDDLYIQKHFTDPVSYTHLDVYKRQSFMNVDSNHTLYVTFREK